jgi:hypothetical protein
MRSARSGNSLMATMPRWLRGMRPKWIVSGSPRWRPRRPSSGRRRRSGQRRRCRGWRASRHTARRGGATRPAGRRPVPRRRGCEATVIGLVRMLAQLRALDHRRPLVEEADQLRSRRVLPCPRSPSRTMSCPAMIARSTWGITVSSKPCRPGHGSSPAARRARRLRADLLAQVRELVAAGAQGAEGGGGGTGSLVGHLSHASPLSGGAGWLHAHVDLRHRPRRAGARRRRRRGRDGVPLECQADSTLVARSTAGRGRSVHRAPARSRVGAP